MRHDGNETQDPYTVKYFEFPKYLTLIFVRTSTLILSNLLLNTR